MFVVSGGYLSNFWALACPSGTKSSLINSWFTKKLKNQSNIWATWGRLLKIRQLKTNFLRQIWDFPDFIWNVDLNLYLSSIEIKAQRTTNNPSSNTACHVLIPTKAWKGQLQFFKRVGALRYVLKIFFVEPVGNDLLNIPSFKSFPSVRNSSRMNVSTNFTHQRLPLSHDHDWPPYSVLSCILKQEKYGKIRSKVIWCKWMQMMQMNSYLRQLSSWIPIESTKTPWVAHRQPILIIAP